MTMPVCVETAGAVAAAAVFVAAGAFVAVAARSVAVGALRVAPGDSGVVVESFESAQAVSSTIRAISRQRMFNLSKTGALQTTDLSVPVAGNADDLEVVHDRQAPDHVARAVAKLESSWDDPPLLQCVFVIDTKDDNVAVSDCRQFKSFDDDDVAVHNPQRQKTIPGNHDRGEWCTVRGNPLFRDMDHPLTIANGGPSNRIRWHSADEGDRHPFSGEGAIP